MKLLEQLISANGVSGNEEDVRRIVTAAIGPLVDEMRVDSSGNVIAHKMGRRPSFMLAAHMDEIGMMVREITSKGLLLCAAVGGVNPLSMIGMRVTVQSKKELIHGIVTTRAISCGDEIDEVPDMEDLVVDTGLTPGKLKALGVTVGAFLEPTKETNWLTYGNTISGKALDDRLGCYCLVEIARHLQNVKQEVFYVFTVQEEMGMQGAKTSAFAIRPGWAIVIDVTAANDLAEEAEKATGTHLVLGKGPCVLHMDEGFIPNTGLIRAIQKVADRNNIVIQHEVSSFGTTDASNISTVRRGVPSATVSIPIRNVHSAVEIGNRKDVENTIKLVAALLKRPPAELLRSEIAGRVKMKSSKPAAQKKTAGKSPAGSKSASSGRPAKKSR